MARLLGVPARSLDRTVACVEAFVQGIAANASAQAIADANEAVLELMGQGEAEGLDTVRSANRIAFMQQSLDATAGLLGNAALLLRRGPERVDAAAPLPAWRSFAAEVARWDSPVQNTRRFAAEQLLLCGEPVAAGQGVLVVLASANRDEALNTNPDLFDVARETRRSMSFGSGVHACPGEAIAVEIAAAALRTLAAAGRLGVFQNHSGYRPLANARIPAFSN
jgi:cytochrome P450